MIDKSTLPENPYVSIQAATVNINSGKKTYKFPLKRIAKMHVRKRKSEQIVDILESLFQLKPACHYTLCIETNDGVETKIKISSLERYYCIRLISMIRNLRKRDLAIA